MTAGQVSDYIGARALLDSLPNVEWLLGDRGYDADWFREALQDKGIKPCIPARKTATAPILRARTCLRQELAGLEKRVRQLAQDDPVCHRLMTMPGVGAVVALTFRAAVDDPARFRSSKKVGPWVGLTPSRNQSGERDVSSGITKAGDLNLRRALCQAATVMMNRARSKWLRTWGAQFVQRRGRKVAMVALARRIAVILHRIWVDGTDFMLDTASKAV